MSAFQNEKQSIADAAKDDWKNDVKKPPKDTRIQTEVFSFFL
jgi:hypothetical protein